MPCKNNCLNCQFFVSTKFMSAGASQFTDAVSSSLRKNILEKKVYPEKLGAPNRTYSEALSCYKGVWNSGLPNFGSLSQIEKFEMINANRKWTCFFLPYDIKGMMMEAAKELEERNAKARSASKDRKRALYGLWVAIAGLFINTSVTLVGADNIKTYVINKYTMAKR